VRKADYKSTERLAKSEHNKNFGAGKMLGHVGFPTDVGDEENSPGGLFSNASRRARRELEEICTLGARKLQHLIFDYLYEGLKYPPVRG
jgi:hypothetical protein